MGEVGLSVRSTAVLQLLLTPDLAVLRDRSVVIVVLLWLVRGRIFTFIYFCFWAVSCTLYCEHYTPYIVFCSRIRSVCDLVASFHFS